MRIPVIFAALALAFSSSATAGAKSDLLSFINSKAPMQTTFVQDTGKGRIQGRIVLGSGGRLRWEELNKSSQVQTLVVSNGKAAWQFEPDLEQAIKINPKETGGWSALFKDAKSLQEAYSVTEQGKILTLKPKRKDLSEVTIEMAHQRPYRVEFSDEMGGKTALYFGAWGAVRVERGVDVFSFVPPRGVDVVGG